MYIFVVEAEPGDGKAILRALREHKVECMLLEDLEKVSELSVEQEVLISGKDETRCLEVLRQIRTLTPAFMIACSQAPITDTALLLTRGADLYMGGPWSTQAIFSHAVAFFRRVNYRKNSLQRRKKVVGELAFDEGDQSFYLKNELMSLSSVEYSILKGMFEEPTRIFSKDEIYGFAHVELAIGVEHVVEVQISNLRKKLKKSELGQAYMINYRGRGYSLIPRGK